MKAKALLPNSLARHLKAQKGASYRNHHDSNFQTQVQIASMPKKKAPTSHGINQIGADPMKFEIAPAIHATPHSSKLITPCKIQYTMAAPLSRMMVMMVV